MESNVTGELKAPAGASTAPAAKSGRFSLDNKMLFAIIIIAILAMAIYVRMGLLQYQGLFEPDGFEYYTAIKQAISQGFVLQNNTVNLSGYPWHNTFGEAPGLLYATLIPYAILQFVGITPLEVMRYVAIFFGLATAVLCYFVVKYLSNSKMLGLLAMIFIALSSGNVARTAGGVYRGDSFIGAFVLLALLFTLMAFREKRESWKYGLMLGAAIIIGISDIVWNGGSLTLAVYLGSTLLVFLYGFVFADKSVLKNNIMMLGALLLGYLLENMFVMLHFANTTNITLTDFAIIFGAVLVANVASIRLLEAKELQAVLGSMLKRIAALCVLGAVLMIVLIIVSPSTFSSILYLNGVVANNNIGYTTQELQKPDFDFLFASFGFELFLAPIGVILYLLFAHKIDSNTSKTTFRNGALGINASYGFAILLAYLLITSYLQSSAIRYNALVSVPIALFAAYAVYITGTLIKPYAFNLGKTQIQLVYLFGGIVFVILIYQGAFVAQESFSSTQADGINPSFLQAALWLSNNTATNATVLTLWPDGSVIEGWGNRTSFMDSTFGENTTRIEQFSQDFLFNDTPAYGYLVNDAQRPDYLFTRSFWFAELAGIAIEGNITGSNLTSYGFSQFTAFNASGTATNQTYTFGNGQYDAELLIKYLANGNRTVSAYVGLASGGGLAPIQHVMFENSTSGAYSIANYTGTAANYTLLLLFSGQQIVGAVLLGPSLPGTNLFKLLMECNYQQCAYNVPGSGVQMQLVYENSDSKIFKINYTN